MGSRERAVRPLCGSRPKWFLASILGGDTIDKLVGMMFSPGRKNSSEFFLWACDHRSSKRTRKLCAKKVVEEVFNRWRDLDETVF